MKLAVVIVNYNVKHYVEQCLHSLERALDGIESEVFVVDNHSKDGSVEYLRSRFSNINIIESNHNLGFARANNIAIRRSSGEYVLLLNPDTFVSEQAIREVIAFADAHPALGGAGVKMYNSDGTLAMESRRGLPTPMTSFYKMCGLCSKFPRSRRFGKYYMSYLGWDNPERIEVISGAFFFVRRSALDKVGLLDTDFFMYGEDIDLSYRLLKGGYENWYLPQAVLHYKGESTHKTSFRYVHVFYQAMLIFFRKHYRHLGLWVSLPIKLAIYFRAFMALTAMVTGLLRRSLGFADRRKAEPKYVFVGSTEMIGQCRDISSRMGMTSEFHEACSVEAVERLGLFDAGVRTVTYLVLDTCVFAYADLLAIMSRRPVVGVKLGTYSSRTRTIITPEEIIR